MPISAFEKYFVNQLCKEATRFYKHYPDMPRYHISNQISLREFDDCYTAPRSGFKDAADYYHQASSKPLLQNIKIPTLILAAKDDPVVATSALENIPSNELVSIKLTESGGHLGFISKYHPTYGIRWMDYYLLQWLGARISNSGNSSHK